MAGRGTCRPLCRRPGAAIHRPAGLPAPGLPAPVPRRLCGGAVLTQLPSLAATAIFSPSIPYTVDGRVRVSGASNFTVNAPFQLQGQIPRTMLIQIPLIGQTEGNNSS